MALAKLNSFILMTALEQHHLVWPVPLTRLELALPFEEQMVPLMHDKVRLLKQRVTGEILMGTSGVWENQMPSNTKENFCCEDLQTQADFPPLPPQRRLNLGFP